MYRWCVRAMKIAMSKKITLWTILRPLVGSSDFILANDYDNKHVMGNCIRKIAEEHESAPDFNSI